MGPTVTPLSGAQGVLALQRGAGNQSVVRALRRLDRCAGAGNCGGGAAPPADAKVGARCACGGTVLPGGECAKCRAERLRSEGMAPAVAAQTVAADERLARAMLQRQPPTRTRPRQPTAADMPDLDVQPSPNGTPCACIVFIHNEERNARLTAQLMHQHCSYNLAIITPDTGRRTFRMPGHAEAVDPNGMFPRDVAEQCLDDPTPCEQFVADNSASTDPSVIEQFVARRFFLAIRECSNAFQLPVVALHNNAVNDTRPIRDPAPDASAIRDRSFEAPADDNRSDPDDRPLRDLDDWLEQKVRDPAARRELYQRKGRTNIYRWCHSPDIGRCHIGDPEHPDTVVWVTKEQDFEDLAAQHVNVVLQTAAPQTGESATDLSTLFLNVGEIIDTRASAAIAALQRGVDVEVDDIRTLLRDLGRLQEHGDLTAGDALAGLAGILGNLAQLLVRLIELALARGERTVRLARVRFINIETPATATASQTPAQVRDENFTSIITILRAAGLDCCSDEPGGGEASVRAGLQRGTP